MLQALLSADLNLAPSTTAVWVTFGGVVFTALTSLGGAWLVAKTRSENSSQHSASQDALTVVASEVSTMGTKLDTVGTKIDSHIGWHSSHDTLLFPADGSTLVAITHKDRHEPERT